MWKLKAGLLALLVSLALAATASGALDESAGPQAAKPRQYDRNAVLKTGRGIGAITSLDPAFNAAGSVYLGLLYDRLLQYDPPYRKIYPQLATSWAFTKDGTALNMRLRNDVKFHDGSPVNAAAVVANINRYKTLPGSRVAVNLAEVASVRRTGPYTLRFNLIKGQGADLPALLTQTIGLVVNPKFFGDSNLGKAPPRGAGSGPYVFKALPSTSELQVTRASSRFWDPRAGLAKEIHVVSIPSTAAGINAYLSGSLDGTNVISDELLQGMNLVKQKRAFGTPFSATSTHRLLLNPKVAPFTNPLYRKAVQAAIDKNGIIQGQFAGGCRRSDQPVPLSHWSYDPKFVNTNSFSVSRARSFLAQAGVPNGFSFRLEYPNFAFFGSQAQAFQGQLAVVGIKADLVALDPATYFARLNSGNWQAFSWGGQVASPDPQSGLIQQLLLEGPSVVVGTQLEAAARGYNAYVANPKYTSEQRTRKFHQLYKWTNDQAISITVCVQTWVYIHRKGVVGGGPAFPSANNDMRYLALLKQ